MPPGISLRGHQKGPKRSAAPREHGKPQTSKKNQKNKKRKSRRRRKRRWRGAGVGGLGRDPPCSTPEGRARLSHNHSRQEVLGARTAPSGPRKSGWGAKKRAPPPDGDRAGGAVVRLGDVGLTPSSWNNAAESRALGLSAGINCSQNGAGKTTKNRKRSLKMKPARRRSERSRFGSGFGPVLVRPGGSCGGWGGGRAFGGGLGGAGEGAVLPRHPAGG